MKNKCSFIRIYMYSVITEKISIHGSTVGYMHFPAMPTAVISQCTTSKKDLPLKKRSTFLS